MKIICTVNSYEELNNILKKDIDGVVISIKKLSVNSSFYMDIDDIKNINFLNKEVFLSINKIMHNNDLEYLRIVLNKIKNMNVRVFFYDMAVYNIAKSMNIENKLIIHQDHLNASIQSNKFYYDLGILGSYITNDITYSELLDIKNNSKMDIFFTCYGYSPIFYSRRYLITNYLKYINNDTYKEYKIKSDDELEYIIDEEEYGTTIYTNKVINLINELDKLEKLDYIVMDGNKIDNSEYEDMIDKFINHEKIDNPYVGFFNTKTIYKVK